MTALNECLGYFLETLHILLQYLFVGKNAEKINISISWPSNDAGNKANAISCAFAVRISIANASSGIWHDIVSVEIDWKSYPTKYESFYVDLRVLTTKYFRLPHDKTDLHLVKLNCIA